MSHLSSTTFPISMRIQVNAMLKASISFSTKVCDFEIINSNLQSSLYNDTIFALKIVYFKTTKSIMVFPPLKSHNFIVATSGYELKSERLRHKDLGTNAFLSFWCHLGLPRMMNYK